MKSKTIGVFVGSLREGAYSRSIAHGIAGRMPEDFSMRFIDISGLPMYNQDYDDRGPVPQAYLSFRDELAALDGFLFVTPEHNRALPAALKNALDVGSRPMQSSHWAGKPGVVVSCSPGKLGGFGANHCLRQVAVCLNIQLMAQPAAYLSNASEMVDETGAVRQSAAPYLQKLADATAAWMNRWIE